MKSYTKYIAILLCLPFFVSCEMKWDENGDLDGMWQMTEWRDKATNAIIKTKHDSIYYCVQLKLIKFQDRDFGIQPLAYFQQTPDSLILGKIVMWPADTVCSYTSVKKYGVPADGRFHIDALNSNHMVLSSTDATLTFRKY